jgi:hypothetical protein
LLCGLSVTFNDKEITEIPKERDPKIFAKSFFKALKEKFGSKEASNYVEIKWHL